MASVTLEFVLRERLDDGYLFAETSENYDYAFYKLRSGINKSVDAIMFNKIYQKLMPVCLLFSISNYTLPLTVMAISSQVNITRSSHIANVRGCSGISIHFAMTYFESLSRISFLSGCLASYLLSFSIFFTNFSNSFSLFFFKSKGTLHP